MKSGLAIETVGDPAAPHVTWFVHGILGRGRNWRGFARRIVEAVPTYRAILVDLRCHGETPPLPGPHDLAACASDLAELAAVDGAPKVVVGHSFGGKVVLAWARDHAVGAPAVWVLDSPPSAVPERDPVHGDPEWILDRLEQIPVPAPDREALRRPLRAVGLSEATVAWLLTSARQDPDGWRWQWDIDGVREMLASYRREDFWPWLSQPGKRAEIDLVRAGRSDRWTDAEIARLAALTPGSNVRAHELPLAGHWLHVDDPEGTFALLAPSYTAH
jgi:pimeloyl-ACP methyl ester carboxylesterase